MSLWSSIQEVITYAFQCFSYYLVSHLTLRPLIHFGLILAQGERLGSIFNFLHIDIQYFFNIQLIFYCKSKQWRKLKKPEK
jgi:hypothetical protein